MKPTIFQAQSKDGFQFSFQIEKSIAKEDGNDLVISGVATTTNVDHDNERMSESAIQSMLKIINEQGVPLRWEHGKDSSAVIGKVYRGHVDERNQLGIDAKLDKNHPVALKLYEDMKNGKRYGLSVGGRIMSASREMAANTGKDVKTFYDVLLDEVSVTDKPANYDAWLSGVVQKSQNESFKKSDLSYSRFLFENPQLDYLMQFAKSIPEDSWKPINNTNNVNKNDMKDENKKDEVKEEGTEKSFVTKAQFDQFSNVMTKAINDLAGVVKAAVEVDAKDTTNPDKSREEMVGDKQVAKDREGQENDGGNGTSAAEGKKESAVPAHDQNTPDKTKEKEVGDSQTVKTEDGVKDDEDEKDTEKGIEDMKDDDEDKEMDKSEEDGDKLPKELKSAMKSITSAIKVIESTTKQLKGVKSIVKSSSKSSLGDSEMGEFVKSIQSFVFKTEETLSKSGKRIPGFASLIADQIRNDSELQKEIGDMMRQPSFKKSRSVVGVPYIVSKEGRKYSLTATPVAETTVEKSENGKTQSFKDMYKSRYSAIREAGVQE
jgi:HK97 family phage prohead protease